MDSIECYRSILKILSFRAGKCSVIMWIWGCEIFKLPDSISWSFAQVQASKQKIALTRGSFSATEMAVIPPKECPPKISLSESISAP